MNKTFSFKSKTEPDNFSAKTYVTISGEVVKIIVRHFIPFKEIEKKDLRTFIILRVCKDKVYIELAPFHIKRSSLNIISYGISKYFADCN